MKKQLFILIFILASILSGCSNKKNKSLAKNYCEQSKSEAEQNNVKQALQLVNKSIELEPEPQNLAYKATLLYQVQDFKECANICKQVINNKNTPATLKADTTNNYACSLLALGKESKAKEIWKQLTTDKNYLSPEVAFMNLGCLELANAIKNQRDETMFKQLITEANEYLTKATTLSPEYIDACYYLAITHIYLKNFQKAKNILEDILIYIPEHKAAESLLKQVKDFIKQQP